MKTNDKGVNHLYDELDIAEDIKEFTEDDLVADPND